MPKFDYLEYCNMDRVKEEYKTHLTSIIPPPDILTSLLDIPPGPSETVFTLDLGGSNLKMALVRVNASTSSSTNQSSQTPQSSRAYYTPKHAAHPTSTIPNNTTTTIQYPNEDRSIIWYDWVAFHIKKYLTNKQVPSHGGVVVSYPLDYYTGNISKARVTRLTKNFPFENVDSLKMDILEELNKRVEDIGMVFNCVLNDSISNFLTTTSSTGGVGVILGTGTNAAFILKDTLYNSEWASFIPDGLRLVRSEKPLIDSLVEEGVQYLDAVCGGCHREDVINAILQSDTNKDSLQSDTKELRSFFIKRGVSCLGSMLMAVISLSPLQDWEVVLNGSIFTNEEAYSRMVEVYEYFKKDEDIKGKTVRFKRNNQSTLEGVAILAHRMIGQ